jgi:hypothetical protein
MTPSTAAAPMPPEESTRRLALLIDADNAQPSVIEALLAEVARFGEATVRRIYGDFTSPGSAGWKKCLNRCSIKPIQQFAYTTGKNATDGTMIIDAMDLLYTRRFDGFCLVTSDSDFTGLAVRLREEGLQVFGFGEQKTPEAFRNACHRFIFTEVLRPAPPPLPEPCEASVIPNNLRDDGTMPIDSTAPTEPSHGQSTLDSPPFPRGFLLQALAQSADETGWSHLGTFGSYLRKIQPDFDSRLHGFRKLSDLVRGRPDLFLVEERPSATGSHGALYVKAHAKG